MRTLDLVRRIHERVAEQAVEIQFQAAPHASSAGSGAVVTSSDGVAILKHTAAELADEASQLEALTHALPSGEIRTTPADLLEGASAALADGIVDEHAVALAARLLPVSSGWPALARALKTTDAHAAWNETSVQATLGRFKDASKDLLARAVADASLPDDAHWPRLSDNAIARLADVLERYASFGDAGR